MRTRTKVILTCILGALFVAGLVLLIFTAEDCLNTYKWWLKIKDIETYGGGYDAYRYRNYIFYFIGIIIFLIFLVINIVFIWTGFYWLRYSYDTYVKSRPYRQAQRKARKEQKLKEKINKLNESK